MKQLAYLTLLTSLFVNLLAARLAFSRTYTGYLDKSNQSFYIVKNNQKLELKYTETSIGKVLRKLSNRDYLSVDAILTPDDDKRGPQVIDVVSINYVGLQELVGFWKDKTGLCYNFMGFTTIKVFIPGPQLKCNARSITEINKSDLTTYNYFINPDDGIWTMLISNENVQYLAELSSISSTKKKLVMYNAEDGKELPAVILYKTN